MLLDYIHHRFPVHAAQVRTRPSSLHSEIHDDVIHLTSEARVIERVDVGSEKVVMLYACLKYMEE